MLIGRKCTDHLSLHFPPRQFSHDTVARTDHKKIMSDIGVGGTDHTVAGADHKHIMTDIGMGGTDHKDNV